MCCTTRMGTGGGCPGPHSTVRRAAGPPVDAPMATTSTRWLRGSLRAGRAGSAGSGVAGGAGGAAGGGRGRGGGRVGGGQREDLRNQLVAQALAQGRDAAGAAGGLGHVVVGPAEQ